MKWYILIGYSKQQFYGLVLILSINIVVWLTQLYLFTLEKNKVYSFNEAKFLSSEIRKEPERDFTRFDPNTIDYNDLLKSGLSKSLSNRIISYRNSVAKFNAPEDLLKIYGMDTNWYRTVKDSVLIQKKKIIKKKSIASKLEFFDPNQVDKPMLRAFGLKPNIIRNWINYLEKGGSFSSCNQLSKIYGMDSVTESELMPYCNLSESQKPKELFLNLNQADSLALIEIKGIGPVFAKRIIEYRELLGGYYDKHQLLEVYGLDSLRLNWILK